MKSKLWDRRGGINNAALHRNLISLFFVKGNDPLQTISLERVKMLR